MTNQNLVKSICKSIAKTSLYSFDEVEDIYNKTHSIDTTILILNLAMALNLTPLGVLHELDMEWPTL